MPLTLYVDTDRWHALHKQMLHAHPGLVPVAKGNGYGFGIPRLAERATELGVDTLAVGTYAEVPAAREHFDGVVMVLSPWRPFEDGAVFADDLIHTVGRLEDLTELAQVSRRRPRVVLERMTSMRRHGFSARELREAVHAWAEEGGVRLEGVALHLPLESGEHLDEVERLMTDVVAAGMPAKRIWVSHLTEHELGKLTAAWPDFEFRPRIGTSLWLGDRSMLRVRATVLDVHAVERGDTFGYRGRSVPRDGHLVVVAGGTAHGIGLEAPTGSGTLRARAASLARGGLDAAGLVRSPFIIDGKQRMFAEPPHMQASMLFLPEGGRVPQVGDEVDVRVRFTATTFDRTVLG